MPITLPPATVKHLQSSMKRYVLEHLDQEIGDLQASLLLDFCLKEVGPSIYNQAIADAQAFMQGRIDDLGGVCYEHEFGYWPSAKRDGKR